jgi:hypothetical protein
VEFAKNPWSFPIIVLNNGVCWRVVLFEENCTKGYIISCIIAHSKSCLLWISKLKTPVSTDLMGKAICLHYKLTSILLLIFPFSLEQQRKDLKYQKFTTRFITIINNQHCLGNCVVDFAMLIQMNALFRFTN